MSKKVTRDEGFSLPPHRNALVHQKIMAQLARMTPDEFFETVVRVGIYDREGHLLPPYADEEEEESSSGRKEKKATREARKQAKASPRVGKTLRSKEK